MDDYFIYVKSYPEVIQVSPQDAEQVRKAITGERPLDFLSLIIQNRKLLIRVSDIAILESRLKP